MNCELPDVQAGYRKGRGTRDQIANICWIMEKAREFQKNIYFCFIDYAKDFDHVDHNKLWKILEKRGIADHLTCLLSQSGTSLLFHIQFYLLLLDVHTGFSGGRSGDLVFPSLEEFSSLWTVIHTVKGFGIVSKAEIDIFLNSLALSMIQQMLAI